MLSTPHPSPPANVDSVYHYRPDLLGLNDKARLIAIEGACKGAKEKAKTADKTTTA